jgi:hypothetical protein
MTLQKKTNELNSLEILRNRASEAAKIFFELAWEESEKTYALDKKINLLKKEIANERRKKTTS